MNLHARTRLGMFGLWMARRALKVEAQVEPDWTHCKWCGADCGHPVTGLPDGEMPAHAVDCPAATGIFPVELKDCFPHGISRCSACNCQLWPGDHYSLVSEQVHGFLEGQDEPVALPFNVQLVTCTGCAVLAGAAQGPKHAY